MTHLENPHFTICRFIEEIVYNVEFNVRIWATGKETGPISKEMKTGNRNAFEKQTLFC